MYKALLQVVRDNGCVGSEPHLHSLAVVSEHIDAHHSITKLSISGLDDLIVILLFILKGIKTCRIKILLFLH